MASTDTKPSPDYRQTPGCVPIPTVAVTAFAMVGDREQALRRGFAGYLSKPLNPYTFATQVDQNLPPCLHGHPDEVAAEHRSDSADVPSDEGRGLKGGPHVLLVDDPASNSEVLARILQPHGFAVTSRSSVAAALATARADRPDLILSDIHIRHESGWDLRRQVLDDPLLAGVPFAFTTATAEPGDDLGQPVEVIRRPIDPLVLLSAVRRLINTQPKG